MPKRQRVLVVAGQRFGRLTVVREVEGPGRPVEFRCDCGATKVSRLTNVRRGTVRSCGCLRREVAAEAHTTHGGAARGVRKRAEYRIWGGILYRCTNPGSPAYARYGGRGIRVCEAWRSSFARFLADVGPRPSPAHSIDRIDNDGDYAPGNCRWATAAEQARNRCQNVWITLDGETRCLLDWAQLRGLSLATVEARMYQRGWSAERAVTQPPATKHATSRARLPRSDG